MFFDTLELTNLCRFQLCHIQHNPDPDSVTGKTRSKTLSLEHAKLLVFIKHNFIQVTHDDITSIEESLAKHLRTELFKYAEYKSNYFDFLFIFPSEKIGQLIQAQKMYLG